MRYDRLHINHFGKLQNIGLSFREGINVIYGPNESGKSTLHAFLEAMQFGMERGRGRAASQDIYTRYFPEAGSTTYGGVLEFTRGETTYSLYRNFYRDPRGFTLMDETGNRALNLTEEEYRELMNNMTPSLYRNTVSLGQLQAATSRDFPEQIRSHIVNLRTAGSASLDLQRAKDRLKKERKALEQSYSRETDARAEELRRQIGELEEDRNALPDSSELPAWKRELAVISQDIQTMKDRHALLGEQIRENETCMEEAAGSPDAPLGAAEERALRLLDRRTRLLSKYPEPSENPLRSAYPALVTGCILAMLLSVLAGIWFLTRRSFVPGIAAFLVGEIFILGGYRLLRQYRALKAFRQVDRSLVRLYESTLAKTPEHVTQQTLEEFLSILEELGERKRCIQRDMREAESLTGQIFRLQEKQQTLSRRLEEKQQAFWRKAQLDEQLALLEDELADLAPRMAENLAIREDIAAIDLAVETMEDISVNAFNSFGSYLQATASELISQITGGRYDRLLIDDDLNITLEQDNTPVELKSLSCSTLDQVYLSLRIACIDFFWPRDTVPILLDESFAMYDSERIQETLTWLSDSYPGQVFLFTCQHREEEIMDAAGIPYHRITL